MKPKTKYKAFYFLSSNFNIFLINLNEKLKILFIMAEIITDNQISNTKSISNINE